MDTPGTSALATIAVIGGTGTLGSALAAAWGRAGHPVVLGSRSARRAEARAAALATGLPPGRIVGTDRRTAARRGDVVVLTVPYAAHGATVAYLADLLLGRIVVDTTVPLHPAAIDRVALPPAGSAALEAQQALPGTDVVSAFQTVSAHHLRGRGPIDCDVLVSGDREAARDVVIDLAAAIGLRAWHVGPLANAAAAEALAPVLIHLNRHHGLVDAGIRITTR